MKQKAKLVATLMAMCMVVSFAVIGILAVKTLNMSVGGNISFFAEGVNFTIGNGAFYQTDKTTPYANITTQTDKMQSFAMNTNTKLADVETQIASWANLDLKLDSQGDAVLKFNIKNDMTDKELYVLFTVTLGTNTNNNMNIVCATSEKLAASANKDIFITFDILDDTINAGLTGFKINLNIGEPVEIDPTTGSVTNQTNSKYSNASYALDTTNGTAKISKSNTNVSGELVLMDKVYSGGQEYVVTEIVEAAFDGCSKLTGDLIIPNTITTIGPKAFTDCHNLNGRLYIPNSIKIISYWAFYGCTQLSGDLILSETLQTIDYSAFVNCEKLSGVLRIPKSVTNIGISAFAGCDAFTEVLVDEENPIYESKGNCIIIKSTKCMIQAFACSEIPQDGSVLRIQQYSFAHIEKGLGNVKLPNDITIISFRAFFKNQGIKSITIGANITQIQSEAFNEAFSLEYVIMESSVPPILGDLAFNYTNGCPIYVPADAVETYKAADGWSVYANRIMANPA